MAKEIKDIGEEDFNALFQAFKSDDVATGQRIIEKHNMHQNTTVRSLTHAHSFAMHQN